MMLNMGISGYSVLGNYKNKREVGLLVSDQKDCKFHSSSSSTLSHNYIVPKPEYCNSLSMKGPQNE